MPHIDTLLVKLLNARGSDLHLGGGTTPMARVHGVIDALGDRALPPEEVATQLREIMPPDVSQVFERTSDVDFAYESPGLGRFRVNVFVDRNGTGGVLRHVPAEVPSLDELKLPEVLKSFAALAKGIVLVTGPTGSGKSTTLAAIVNEINTRRKAHIITIEDPIEFVHSNKLSLINQREVGAHTESFSAALRAALREDPDVILLGEMRDLETTAMAIEAAETGHLVLGTLHTASAASTVDRIIDQFASDRQSQVRTMLSGSLQGVVSQCLLRRKNGEGRVAAVEILVSTAAVSSMIRDQKSHQIPSAIQTGGRMGMTTMNDSLVRLAGRQLVDPHDAFVQSTDRDTFVRALNIAGISYVPPTAFGGAPGGSRGVPLEAARRRR